MFIAANGQRFEEAAVRQQASGEHCRLETPHYAQTIASFALANAAAVDA